MSEVAMAPHVGATVRLANINDASSAARVFVASRETWTFFDAIYDVEFFADMFEMHESPRGNFWVAERDREVVGMMVLDGDRLERLYVLPQYQGQGVGKQLLDHAKHLSPDSVELWVFQKNIQAIRFYERNGFVVDHLTDGQGNMEEEPDAFYIWRPRGETV